MALGPPHWSALRRELQTMLRSDGSRSDNQEKSEKNLLPLAETEFFVPAEIGDYTDFYASLTMPSRSAACFALKIRWCQITNIFPSDTTAERPRSW